MIKVALFGIGRMGEAVAQKIIESDIITLAELYEKDGSPLVGRTRFNVVVQADEAALQSAADVFVDFTEPDAAIRHFHLAVQLHRPIVVGTTGLSRNQLEEVRAAAERIPCLFAPNLSLGVNLLYELASQAARTLPLNYDVDIIELHHRHKADQYSGTALQLERVISSQREQPARLHAVRAGDIVGVHRIVFSGPGERLELVHEASSRAALAAGVVTAVKFLFGRSPGLYFVGDALGLR